VDERVVIVGAGPAGLAAAWAIGRTGLDPLVVDQADSVAASWRGRHDHLRLNTHRMFSHQPGGRIPRRYGPFPARDDYVAYLQNYAAGIRVRLGTRVHRVDRADAGWELRLAGGSVTAAHVVIATGPDAEPVMPSWPGMATFGGVVIHAGQFRNVREMAGLDVLVVGAGNSGVDLLSQLAGSGAGKLWLSARSGMNITPLRLAGLPLHPVSVLGRHLPMRWQDANARAVQRLAFGDLTRLGYPRSVRGAFTRASADGVTVAVDDGFVRALKAGRVTMKPAIDRSSGPEVHFIDGTSCAPDAIICATGYRPGLEQVVGHLVTLDARGMPPFTGACASPQHHGLWFFGLDRSIYGNMHVRRRQARQLAQAIRRPPQGEASMPHPVQPGRPSAIIPSRPLPAAHDVMGQPLPGRNKPASQKAANHADAQLRVPGEQAHAQLKSWHILRKLRCCPWRNSAWRLTHNMLPVHPMIRLNNASVHKCPLPGHSRRGAFLGKTHLLRWGYRGRRDGQV
jgi:putative flavoprotein involved in K+ transport